MKQGKFFSNKYNGQLVHKQQILWTAGPQTTNFKDRDTERQRYRQTEKRTEGHTDKQTYMKADRQKDC